MSSCWRDAIFALLRSLVWKGANSWRRRRQGETVGDNSLLPVASVQGLGCRVWDAGFGMQGSGFGVWGVGFWDRMV